MDPLFRALSGRAALPDFMGPAPWVAPSPSLTRHAIILLLSSVAFGHSPTISDED